MTAPAEPRADDLVRTLVRDCWSSLPALSLASVVVCLAALVPVLAAPGVNAVSIALVALVCGPALAGLVATVDLVAEHGEAGVRAAAARFRLHAGDGVRAAFVPGVCAELFLAAWRLWSQHRGPLLVPSLGLTGGATVLGLLAYVVALGLIPHRRPGDPLWRPVAALSALRPVRFLAVFTAAALGVWLVLTVSVSLALVVPVPVAVVLVAAVRTTCDELSGARPDAAAAA